MKQRFFTLFILLFSLTITSHAHARLSDEATVSLLTGEPFEEEIYTVFGHSSIRVVDAEQSIDILFNYGHFSFDRPNFIYHFVKGETDYKLMAYDTRYYIAEATMNGIGLTEQVLNFSPEEKQALWEALVWNARPENAEYRYNFFYDNCATRPADLIEKYVDGEVVYNFPEMHVSFRDLINHCMRNKPWMMFGTDLVLGTPTDKEITPRETFFLPTYLRDGLATAKFIDNEGVERPAVLQTNVLLEETNEADSSGGFTPIYAAMTLFVFLILISLIEWKKKIYLRWFDVVLFTVLGLAGCIVYFISFVSVHPATWPNWSVLWLHPFHLIGVVFMVVKKLNKVAIWYHFVNFATLLLLVIALCFFADYKNGAVLGIAFAVYLRSYDPIRLWRKERQKERNRFLEDTENK